MAVIVWRMKINDSAIFHKIGITAHCYMYTIYIRPFIIFIPGSIVWYTCNLKWNLAYFKAISNLTYLICSNKFNIFLFIRMCGLYLWEGLPGVRFFFSQFDCVKRRDERKKVMRRLIFFLLSIECEINTSSISFFWIKQKSISSERT